MADLSDVEAALVSLIAGYVFPNPGYLPGSSVASRAVAVPVPTIAVPSPVSGLVSVRLYRGWPESAALDADLRASVAHISVFSEQGVTRNVSRYSSDPVQISVTVPTITATLSGYNVTLAGAITAGNVVGVMDSMPGQSYHVGYVVLAGDSLATVATKVALLITGASAVGAVITLPPSPDLAASTEALQQAMTVTRQQQQGIRVSIWAATPQARDAICSLVDNGLAGMRNANGYLTRFFAVGAFETAHLAYRASYTNDLSARDRIWRRDLCYTIEYATTLIETDPTMLFGGGSISVTR